MYATTMTRPDFSKMIRILILAAMLTVGSLQVTRCSEDEDISAAANDQYNRMHKIVVSVVGE
jgi:hypothetical protein